MRLFLEGFHFAGGVVPLLWHSKTLAGQLMELIEVQLSGAVVMQRENLFTQLYAKCFSLTPPPGS